LQYVPTRVPHPIYTAVYVPYPVTVENAKFVNVPFPVYNPVPVEVPVEVPVYIPHAHLVPKPYVIRVPSVENEPVTTYLNVPRPYEIDVPVAYEVNYPVSYEQEKYYADPYIVNVPQDFIVDVPVVENRIHPIPHEVYVPQKLKERYPRYETKYHPMSYKESEVVYYDVPYDIVVPVPVEHDVYVPEPYIIDVHKQVHVPEPYHVFHPHIDDSHSHDYAIGVNVVTPFYQQSFSGSDLHEGFVSNGGTLSEGGDLSSHEAGLGVHGGLGEILAEHGSFIHGEDSGRGHRAGQRVYGHNRGHGHHRAGDGHHRAGYGHHRAGHGVFGHHGPSSVH